MRLDSRTVVLWIIHGDFGLKYLLRLAKRLFPIIVSVSYINISQGSVRNDSYGVMGHLTIALLQIVLRVCQ